MASLASSLGRGRCGPLALVVLVAALGAACSDGEHSDGSDAASAGQGAPARRAGPGPHAGVAAEPTGGRRPDPAERRWREQLLREHCREAAPHLEKRHRRAAIAAVQATANPDCAILIAERLRAMGRTQRADALAREVLRVDADRLKPTYPLILFYKLAYLDGTTQDWSELRIRQEGVDWVAKAESLLDPPPGAAGTAAPSRNAAPPGQAAAAHRAPPRPRALRPALRPQGQADADRGPAGARAAPARVPSAAPPASADACKPAGRALRQMMRDDRLGRFDNAAAFAAGVRAELRRAEVPAGCIAAQTWGAAEPAMAWLWIAFGDARRAAGDYRNAVDNYDVAARYLTDPDAPLARLLLERLRDLRDHAAADGYPQFGADTLPNRVGRRPASMWLRHRLRSAEPQQAARP